jgi:hypothetical protein
MALEYLSSHCADTLLTAVTWACISALRLVQLNFKGSLNRDDIQLTSLVVLSKDYNVPPIWNHRIVFSLVQRCLYVGNCTTKMLLTYIRHHTLAILLHMP